MVGKKQVTQNLGQFTPIHSSLYAAWLGIGSCVLPGHAEAMISSVLHKYTQDTTSYKSNNHEQYQEKKPEENTTMDGIA